MAAAPEKTIILNPSGERLVGILDDSGTKDLIVLCHGTHASKDVGLIVNVSSMLKQSGLSVFRFDFSGNGESQGEFQVSDYLKEVEDLHSVVLYWTQQGRVVKALIGHSKEKTIILNPSGERLVGILDDSGSKDLIVLCHGMRGSKDLGLLVNVSSMLKQSGLSVFRFDFSGNGESEGEFQLLNHLKEVEDLRSVVLYWTQQGRVVKAIIGHSKGGSVVLLYASEYHDVHTVSNVAGRIVPEDLLKGNLGEDSLDVKDESGKTIRVTREAMMEQLETDLKTAASTIPKDCRVLTVLGSKDDIITIKDALEVNELVPNHTLQIIDGADHNFTHHERELADVLTDFIERDFDKHVN